jgi:hypothetical protein
MLDLFEEPLDQISGSVEIRAETDRLVAIASWRDIGPGASLGGMGPDPVGVIAPVRQQHRSRFQARQKLACKPIVVCLTSRQGEPDRQAIRIDQCVNLAGQPAA